MLLNARSAREFLHAELEKRIRINARYSLRAFAKHLKFSPGELSEILRDKRKLTLKNAAKIVKILNLSEGEAGYPYGMVQRDLGLEESSATTSESADAAESTAHLALDMFHIVADWYCFGILNLADCPDFRWDHNWIARRLGISKTEVELAIERLLRVGLVVRQGTELRIDHQFVFSRRGVPSEAIRHYHRQMLKKAADALDLQTVQEREINGLGIALDPDWVPQIKKEVEVFLTNIVTKYAQKKAKRKEVYQLELALFRLTERDDHL